MVYSVVSEIAGEEACSYFVSDGQGPDIELASRSLAGAIARCMDVRAGMEVSADVAEMWLRNGAIERRFTEIEDGEKLDDNHRLQAFTESFMDNPIGEPVFVGIENPMTAVTEATTHRIDASRNLGAYVTGPRR